jgi:hypothetical protein
MDTLEGEVGEIGSSRKDKPACLLDVDILEGDVGDIGSSGKMPACLPDTYILEAFSYVSAFNVVSISSSAFDCLAFASASSSFSIESSVGRRSVWTPVALVGGGRCVACVATSCCHGRTPSMLVALSAASTKATQQASLVA